MIDRHNRYCGRSAIPAFPASDNRWQPFPSWAPPLPAVLVATFAALLATVGPALTLTLLGFSTSQVDAQNLKEAGASYQKNCMSCHQPPDLRFATDRAWVGQIRETA